MKKFMKYILIILGIVLLDQITKSVLLYLITGTVPVYGSAWSVVSYPYLMSHIANWFNIVFTWNPGASFSLLRTLGEGAPWVITIATGLIIGLLVYYMRYRSAQNEKLPLAFIIGGALGNFIDRLRFGAVIDFLDFHHSWIGDISYWFCNVWNWCRNIFTDVNSCTWNPHWPAFNIADSFIVIGVILYIINLIFHKK